MMERDTSQERRLVPSGQQAITGQQFNSRGSLPVQMDVETEGQEQGTSLRDILSVIRRRKAIAIRTFLLVVALGVALTFMTKPLYRSTARILVEGKASTIALSNTTDPLSNLFLPSTGHDVVTQIEILRSPAILEKAHKASGVAPSQVALDVRRVGATDVVELNVTSGSPDSAQKFATALPQVYLEDVKGKSVNEITSALQFARQRVDEENKLLRVAELKLEEFKTRTGIINPEVELKQDVEAAAEARAALSQATSEAASAQARLGVLRSARSGLPATTVTPTTVTNNAQIEELQNRLELLKEERARQLFLYKPQDDEVKKVDLQIAEVERRLRQVPKTVTTITRTPNEDIGEYDVKIADAYAELQEAQAKVATSQAAVSRTAASLGKYNPAERAQAQLQREIEGRRDSLDMLGKSVEELGLREKAAQATGDPVTIIAAAGPGAQVAPQVTRNIVLALLLGLLMACGAAMLQETLDDHITDEEEARHLIGMPVLGHSPMIPEGQSRVLQLSESNPRLLERFRVLRTNVQFTLLNLPKRTLLITSTLPGEGKTSTAVNLAFAMAMDKRRVILVDADLRLPSVHKVFGMENRFGLTNVLVGQMDLHSALQDTPTPGLRVLTSGALPPNSAELLNSPAMDDVLRVLKEEADVVIFDCSPNMAAADAQVLSAKVDGVIYVMELGKVPKSAVQRSFELLHRADAHILGILFNKVGDEQTDGYDYYGKSYTGEHLHVDDEGEGEGVSKAIYLNGDSKTPFDVDSQNGVKPSGEVAEKSEA
jgi:capsular exopolysaccharide synthesis family protein